MATEVVPNIEDEAYEPQTYDEAFPALHSHRNDAPATISHGDIKLVMRSTKTTQIFTVPLEERRFKEINEHSFGEEGEQAKICREIMQRNGVSIEMSLAKDQSLTVVISGKPEDVMKARREVVSELQTQASYLIKIPKEHHRFILGKNAKKLHELELNTSTKILIPRTDNSDAIRIVGTKEGIEKARHEIQCTSDEQAKLAFERLPVPKIYHPFICGPHNNNIKNLMETTNARINVPPPSVMKDEIVVSGEKEGVMKAKAVMMQILEEKKRKCQAVSVEVRKSQHKYVIGQKRVNIQEILEATGVSVEVPSLESNSGTITLRGEEDKLGPALTMVYSKANSVIVEEVTAPAWLHRFIIGRQGANVKKITQNTPKVHIEFTDGEDTITLEGPPEEVEECVNNLTAFVSDLEQRMAFAEIEVDQRFHKHIIGKNGANISRIKNETGVAIQIPSDNVNNVIRIEGDPVGVQKAKQELLDMAQRMENEKSREILIEQRFHKTIIGARGEKIREIREMFNQVQITFPDAGKKSDVVILRGPKNDVDKAYKHLHAYHQELVTNNFQSQVQIFKAFHKNIIGKGGATIRKIRDETDTRIELPSENTDSDMIIITGKKANVELATKKIEAIQKELANIKEITVDIPSKFHNSIIGAKGRLIRAILEECSGVLIRFPPEGSSCDKVVIRGPIEDAENARRQLQELTSEKQMSSFTADIKAKPEYHKFLIGRGGANIKKVREKTGARVIFPTDQDNDPELISIIGRKESVEQAKLELEGLIQNLDNIVEGEINVDPKHHRYFVARRGEVLRQIADDYGGVTVSFPRSGVKSDRVVIKGAKDCVEGAKRRILEIVADLDAQVVVECVISQKFHRTVMGARGLKVQEITRVHDVAIKFPDRPVNGERSSQPPTEETDSSTTAIPNGDVSPDSETPPPPDTNKTDVIIITGKPNNCEEAKKALLALVPITVEVEVPFEFHRFIIGQKGKDVRKMMEDHEVSITVPPPEDKSNVIAVTGPPSNVQGAKVALEEKCVVLENEKQDKILRSFKLEIEVEPTYHPKIIGRKGAVISKIRADHDVNIQFPDRGDAQNVITIVGYEANATKAKEAILKIVEELDSMSSIEVKVDHRVHPRIIGLKGRTVRRLMEDYKVDIRFPRQDTDDPDTITITGAEEDCLDCKDYLMTIEEEYLQDVIDQEYLDNLKSPPRAEVNGATKASKGFFVKDAPWDKVPDTASTDEFPSFGTVVTPKPSQAWGPLKRK